MHKQYLVTGGCILSCCACFVAVVRAEGGGDAGRGVAPVASSFDVGKPNPEMK